METPSDQLLASWLEANINIPAASSRHGKTGIKNAQEFVNVSEASADDESCFTAPGTDPQSLKQVLCEKTYDCAIAKTYVGGREQQMGTFRRVAEIEALFERQRRMTMEVRWSPWSNGTLEPLPAFFGQYCRLACKFSWNG